MSDSSLSSKLRLAALAFAALAGGAGALVLASTGTAGQEECNDKIFGDGGDKAKGKGGGGECAGGIPNPSDPSTDPDIATTCESERGVRIEQMTTAAAGTKPG